MRIHTYSLPYRLASVTRTIHTGSGHTSSSAPMGWWTKHRQLGALHFTHPQFQALASQLIPTRANSAILASSATGLIARSLADS